MFVVALAAEEGPTAKSHIAARVPSGDSAILGRTPPAKLPARTSASVKYVAPDATLASRRVKTRFPVEEANRSVTCPIVAPPPESEKSIAGGAWLLASAGPPS